MVKRGQTKGAKSRAPSQWTRAIVEPILGLFELFSRIIDRFGWPGLALILGFYFVERNATAEQKTEIINIYILGQGMEHSYVVGVICVVALLIFFAQDYYWRRKDKILREEIDRLAKWKSLHQQEGIDTNLHHTERSAQKKGGRK